MSPGWASCLWCCCRQQSVSSPFPVLLKDKLHGAGCVSCGVSAMGCPSMRPVTDGLSWDEQGPVLILMAPSQPRWVGASSHFFRATLAFGLLPFSRMSLCNQERYAVQFRCPQFCLQTLPLHLGLWRVRITGTFPLEFLLGDVLPSPLAPSSAAGLSLSLPCLMGAWEGRTALNLLWVGSGCH